MPGVPRAAVETAVAHSGVMAARALAGLLAMLPAAAQAEKELLRLANLIVAPARPAEPTYTTPTNTNTGTTAYR